MPRGPENPGTCAYCGEIITKRGVVKHLDKYPKRQEALSTAEASSRPVDTLWYLRVQDAYDKDFWLDLEMAGSASLDKLDKYLRAIRLECCGSNAFYQQLGITLVPDLYLMNHPSGLQLVFSHCPIIPLERGVLHLHGHIHNNVAPELGARHVNLCIEVRDYRPQRLGDILAPHQP